MVANASFVVSCGVVLMIITLVLVLQTHIVPHVQPVDTLTAPVLVFIVLKLKTVAIQIVLKQRIPLVPFVIMVTTWIMVLASAALRLMRTA